MTILVTGGAGFIGSNFILDWLAQSREPIVNLDLLTYAGNLANLDELRADPRHIFVRGDIRDEALVDSVLQEHAPRAIAHFAAETHVDRSIQRPDNFIQTNVSGTFVLLEAARRHHAKMTPEPGSRFRFLHVSTDEVFGSLEPHAPPFTELHRYAPNSPYSASKAASNHLVRAWHRTYDLPVLTANCCNSYGPRQFPEKLIPLVIRNALAAETLPIYGDGQQVRDWLHVSDQCAALRTVLEKGQPGENYNIGGRNERTNVSLVQSICDLLDEFHPAGAPHARLIAYVADRPGHDRRYAVDASKVQQLGWIPKQPFDAGLRQTVRWYVDRSTGK
jgi:dTDP-glucose 4,6-dehydratase